MLCVQVEYRTEFSFWSLASSPLIFATDPRDLSPIMKEVNTDQRVRWAE